VLSLAIGLVEHMQTVVVVRFKRQTSRRGGFERQLLRELRQRFVGIERRQTQIVQQRVVAIDREQDEGGDELRRFHKTQSSVLQGRIARALDMKWP
jgi:hypothetical protein